MTETTLKIEDGIPIYQTRGRPACNERVALVTMRVGQSFVSYRKRDSLYWLGRDLGIDVTVLSNGDGGWRVWKKSERGVPRPRTRKKKKLLSEQIV